jgi:hypothetical protein
VSGPCLLKPDRSTTSGPTTSKRITNRIFRHERPQDDQRRRRPHPLRRDGVLHLINPEVAGPDLGTRTIREKMKELGLVAQTGKRGNVRVVR